MGDVAETQPVRPPAPLPPRATSAAAVSGPGACPSPHRPAVPDTEPPAVSVRSGCTQARLCERQPVCSRWGGAQFPPGAPPPAPVLQKEEWSLLRAPFGGQGGHRGVLVAGGAETPPHRPLPSHAARRRAPPVDSAPGTVCPEPTGGPAAFLVAPAGSVALTRAQSPLLTTSQRLLEPGASEVRAGKPVCVPTPGTGRAAEERPVRVP